MAILKRVKNFLAPLPVALVTVRLRDNDKVADNIIPISWAGIVESAPHMISINISRGKYSGEIIKKTKQFGVAISGSKYIREVDICGTTHGDKVDKFSLTGFEKMDASIIDVPLIKQCPINMECKLEDIIPFKSHDMFIGKIEATHLDDGFADENGEPDFKKINILCYANGDYWDLGTKLKKLYFTKTKK